MKTKQVIKLHDNADRVYLSTDRVFYREFDKDISYLGSMQLDGSDKRLITEMNYLHISYNESNNCFYYINSDDNQSLWLYDFQNQVKRKIFDKQVFSFTIIENKNIICAQVYEGDNIIEGSFYFFGLNGDNPKLIEIN